MGIPLTDEQLKAADVACSESSQPGIAQKTLHRCPFILLHPIILLHIITTLLLHHISFHIHVPRGPKFLCAQGGFARGSLSWASETAGLYS